MQINEIQPIHKRKSRKRVGRGGKRGTYSGRGNKGQKSRAGTHKSEPIIRGLLKRYHKLRGYRMQGKDKKGVIVNLFLLEEKFKDGDKITPEILFDRKIIGKIKGRMPKVKILGKGKVSKKLIFEGCDISKSAKKVIEEAGGLIKSKAQMSNVKPFGTEALRAEVSNPKSK